MSTRTGVSNEVFAHYLLATLTFCLPGTCIWATNFEHEYSFMVCGNIILDFDLKWSSFSAPAWHRSSSA